ncbi:copper amine oxidase [Selenomonadales bacterium OttesenSCG-928-I06]|nr:copper amine oxidase [Selenomonadales bacterium OttesenSCG-928-I06]
MKKIIQSVFFILMICFFFTSFNLVSFSKDANENQILKPESRLLNKNILKIEEMSVKVRESDDILILSDSPEMVKKVGIMYQDTVSGDVRLFFHHVNDTPSIKKILVLLINEGTETAEITITNYGLGGPGYDYLKIGKDVQDEYFDQKNYKKRIAYPGETILLDPQLDTFVVKSGELLNGMYDFKTTAPVKVVVMMMPVYEKIPNFLKIAKILPCDKERLRGTFKGKDRLIILDKNYKSFEDGYKVITLADNKVDKFSYGIDATDGSQTQNYGNYGVMYHLYLPSHSESNFSMFLNPRGGVYAGNVLISYKHAFEDNVKTPRDRLFFGQDSTVDFAHLGDFRGGYSLWMTFSPPGASNLPVKLILVPNEEKHKK